GSAVGVGSAFLDAHLIPYAPYALPLSFYTAYKLRQFMTNMVAEGEETEMDVDVAHTTAFLSSWVVWLSILTKVPGLLSAVR
ncbi:MAG TPA: hypothetical protein VLG71_02810, partial [Candidatus Limnocylindria bacterium]|nr:hypothetical protein [Candidatus Limnocylindria bacterium]